MALMMRHCLALLLLVAAARAGLVENQDGGLQRAPSIAYKSSRLRCYQMGPDRIVQPYITMQLPQRARVLRDSLGNGFYFRVPLRIVAHMKLPSTTTRRWHMLKVYRFRVQLRDSPCKKRCPRVSVLAEWRRGGAPAIRFRCNRRAHCRRLLQSLRFKGERSRNLRSSLRFTFFGRANDMNFALSRVGLPVAGAKKRPFRREFWFEGDKLVLFGIRANIGVQAFPTFQSEQNYAVPRSGALPDVYRSRLVDQMAAVASKGRWEIVAEMRKAGRTVARAVFSGNPNGLNKNTWLSNSRLKSSWPYWIGHSTYNFFSPAGDAGPGRRFYINHNYGGCPADRGFFVVSDKRDVCPWGNRLWRGRAPAIIYAPYANLPFQSNNARAADYFLVYMRMARTSARAAPSLPGAYRFEGNKILLFSISSNSGHKAADTFLNSGLNSPIPRSGNVPSLFRSNLIDNLPTAHARTGLHYIVAEMRAGSRMLAQVVFDISTRRSALNKDNWFRRDRVVSSHPYALGGTFNFFSIRGHQAIGRSFFISFRYAGCDHDQNFWVVSDKRDPCLWAHRHFSKAPAFIYTASRTRALHSAKYNANRFVVYLK